MGGPAEFTSAGGRGASPFPGLGADAPVALERPAHVVGSWIHDADLGLAFVRGDDRILPEHAAERDGFVAVHAVYEPSGLAPDALGFRLGADAGLDAVAAENAEIAHHDVPCLVHAPRQEH